MSTRRDVRPVRSGRRVLLFLALLVTLTSLALPARAQGLRGKFPDPISTVDLELLDRRLTLGPAQQEAMAREHLRYLDAFQALRDGAIAQLLERNKWIGTVYYLPDDTTGPEQELREQRRCLDQIRQLDIRFYDALHDVLSDDQQLQLPALRRLRHRTRLCQGPAWMTGSPYLRADLCALLEEIDLTAEERTTARAVLDTYEPRLLAALRSLHEETVGLRIVLLEVPAETQADARARGLSPGFIHHRNVYCEHARLATAVGAAHRKALADLQPVLSAPAGDALWDSYRRLVYPSTPDGLGPADALLFRALENPKLTGPTRESIAELRDQFHAEARRLKEEMYDVLDALQQSNASHPLQMTSSGEDYEYEDPQDYHNRVRTHTRALAALTRSTAEMLGDITGEPYDLASIAGALIDEADAPPPPRMGWLAIGETHGHMDIPAAQLPLQFTPATVGALDRFLPPPISERDLERYCVWLQFNDDDQLLFEEIRQTYLDAFEHLRTAGPVARVRNAERAIFARDGSGGMSIPTTDQIDELFTLRRAALRAITALDDRFFADMALVWEGRVTEETVARLRRDRHRAVYQLARPADTIDGVPAPPFMFADAESEETYSRRASLAVNLAHLVLEIRPQLRPEVRQTVDEILEVADIHTTKLLQRHFDVWLEMEHRRALMMAAHLEPDPEVENVFDAWSIKLDADYERLDERCSTLMDEIRTAHRDALTQVLAALPPAERWTLECRYWRVAFPAVYLDTEATHTLLARALNLENLTADCRERLIEREQIDRRRAGRRLDERLRRSLKALAALRRPLRS